MQWTMIIYIYTTEEKIDMKDMETRLSQDWFKSVIYHIISLVQQTYTTHQPIISFKYALEIFKPMDKLEVQWVFWKIHIYI